RERFDAVDGSRTDLGQHGGFSMRDSGGKRNLFRAKGERTKIQAPTAKSQNSKPKLTSQVRHKMDAQVSTNASRFVVQTNSKFEIPKSKIQIPNKSQIPNPKF